MIPIAEKKMANTNHLFSAYKDKSLIYLTFMVKLLT